MSETSTKKRKRVVFSLSDVQRSQLEKIASSRTEKHSRVMRAKFILAFANHDSIQQIADRYHVPRVKIERTLDKVEMVGPIKALDDLQGRGRKKVISDPAHLWMLHVACTSPQECGLPYEVWSHEKLAKYYRTHGPERGYPSLAHIQKGTVCKFLRETNLKPFRIKYYVDSSDPQFEEKMTQILLLYKKVHLCLEEKQKRDEEQCSCPVPEHSQIQEWTVVSYDEKPGVQCIENKRKTKMPLSCQGKNTHVSRDYEYIRHGTVSLLSGIDLLDGHIHMDIKERHRSKEFVGFLQELDEYYPPHMKIDIILDNHSVHTSKETRAYLKEHPDRFQFTFTPTHGSWLNMIEMFFGKVQRCFLKHLRVKSKEEFIERMTAYIEELNKEPVIFRWKYKLETVEENSIPC